MQRAGGDLFGWQPNELAGLAFAVRLVVAWLYFACSALTSADLSQGFMLAAVLSASKADVVVADGQARCAWTVLAANQL